MYVCIANCMCCLFSSVVYIVAMCACTCVAIYMYIYVCIGEHAPIHMHAGLYAFCVTLAVLLTKIENTEGQYLNYFSKISVVFIKNEFDFCAIK